MSNIFNISSTTDELIKMLLEWSCSGNIMFIALHVVNNDEWNIFFLLFVILNQYAKSLSYLNQCDKRGRSKVIKK